MKMGPSLLAAYVVLLLIFGVHGTSTSGQITLQADVPPLEILPIIISGPPENRIDFTFFADGYLQSERDKFVSDVTRLAEDISQNQTFNTVQPLMNFWAAFTPSNQSGIGFNEPGDTAFGSYRYKTGYRVVVAGYQDIAKAARDSMGAKCDFPIVLANDPYYGGLDGEITSITSSLVNGALVLRHELGHSILGVGEEYDGGGEEYWGSNSANTTERASLPWAQWLSDSSRVGNQSNPRVERSTMPLLDYPWATLNTSTPWKVNFESSGDYHRYQVQFSVASLPNRGDLKVTLDGSPIDWVPKDGVGLDRWFYAFNFNEGLKNGTHTVQFELLNSEWNGKAQLASVEVVEYGNEDEFKLEPGFYGLYPTHAESENTTTYRPTNNDCLMRNVTVPQLCKSCMETLWNNFLGNISLVDNITESCTGTQKVLDLHLLPLAQFRGIPVTPKEAYTITWKKGGEPLENFKNQTRVLVDGDEAIGTYSIHVKFSTEEVRKPSSGLEKDVEYEVKIACPA
ncbi:IgA peptidase M64-domain-containing protein [Crepidotus variabilis]|uniref:IgA peptidase M64-domain-containing protein n=1 Tax=Crepidotus variabilis TaxID=179855 RepID=A0A9P6E818_9AGAR|nr:IgA peptidase M64-domain-containing protein [Crepidotus variabilis]